MGMLTPGSSCCSSSRAAFLPLLAPSCLPWNLSSWYIFIKTVYSCSSPHNVFQHGLLNKLLWWQLSSPTSALGIKTFIRSSLFLERDCEVKPTRIKITTDGISAEEDPPGLFCSPWLFATEQWRSTPLCDSLCPKFGITELVSHHNPIASERILVLYLVGAPTLHTPSGHEG